MTTNPYGEWSARVPAGPSRLLEAVYPGDSTTEPATSGTVVLTVPAKIGVSITPRVLPWHATLTIRGHLEGGYVPPGGVALRLLVRYTGSPQASVLLAFRTNGRGQFKIGWRYPSGHGVASYPMWVSTTAAETDYAFAPSRSRRTVVTFGRRTPHHRHHGRHRAAQATLNTQNEPGHRRWIAEPRGTGKGCSGATGASRPPVGSPRA